MRFDMLIELYCLKITSAFMIEPHLELKLMQMTRDNEEYSPQRSLNAPLASYGNPKYKEARILGGESEGYVVESHRCGSPQ